MVKNKKLNLFDDDNEGNNEGEDGHSSNQDDVENFNDRIEKKLKKNSGQSQKLIELQSRFASDSRFQMDEHFLDDDDDEKDGDVGDKQQSGESEFIEENDKNISILEKVLGKTLKKPAKPEKKFESNSLKLTLTTPRYDPTKEESKIYELPDKELDISRKKIRIDFDKVEEKLEKVKKVKFDDEKQTKSVNTVKTETFYEVSSDLKDALAKKDEEFSFASFFGVASSSNDSEQKKREQLRLSNEQSNYEELKSDQFKNPFKKNPFKYDSSDSEGEDDHRDSEVKKANSKKVQKSRGKISFSDTFGGFFFTANDPRFQEDHFYSEELVKNVNEAAQERQLEMTKAFSFRKRAVMKNVKTEKKNEIKRRLKMRMLQMRRNKNWKYGMKTKMIKKQTPGQVGVVNVAKS